VLRSRKRGSVHSLSHTSSGCSAVKHRDFTFTYKNVRCQIEVNSAVKMEASLLYTCINPQVFVVLLRNDFDPEDRGSIFLWNVHIRLQDCAVLQLRRLRSEFLGDFLFSHISVSDKWTNNFSHTGCSSRQLHNSPFIWTVDRTHTFWKQEPASQKVYVDDISKWITTPDT
jgi:hypothetical protein